MMIDIKDIINNLGEAGRTLIFCDDSDIQGQPDPNFVSDLRVLCAIKIDSANYDKLDISKKLDRLSVKEFHATEVVNPNSNSAWKKVEYEDRLAIFNHMKFLLTRYVMNAYYCYISKSQYNVLRKKAEEIGSVSAQYKTGLKRVFLRTLFERLRILSKPVVLVMDQEKKINKPQIESWEEGEFLEGGGPIVADSSLVHGLQLADFAVYSISRYVRSREKIKNDTANQFDIIAAETLAELGQRVEFLL
jgi:hypothetical protein